ncbi:hypothetical protein BT93_F1130 [Corymbia citriodora subsp. variegata]|nr:hypothetical protein BT93_F1130 [Corymbia citriodora subsp. variegata]
MACLGRNLKKVEGLYCSVPYVETFNAWVRFLEQNGSRPYELWLNELGDHVFKDMHERHIIIKSCHSIATRIDEEIGGDGSALLPKNVEVLKVGRLDNLGELEIEEWEKLEELGVVHFPHLWRLNITGCSKLKHLCEVGHGLPQVYRCPKTKRVVEWKWLATLLPNLRSIKIRNCEKLEEIIEGPAMSIVEDCQSIEVIIIETVPNILQPSFLNLTHLTLSNLPELKSICDRTMSCFSIQYMRITNCPKLRRLPLLDNGPPCPPRDPFGIWIDKQMWQSLEWVHSLRPPSLLGHLARIYEISNIFQLFSLKPREEGVPNWHDQRMPVTISCDNIVARAYGEISGDGRDLLAKNVRVLTNVEELTIEGWEKLEELGVVTFLYLQGLNIILCYKLKHLSVEEQGLPNLQWFTIGGSKELEGIDLIAPTLNSLEVSGCPQMKRVVEWDWLATRVPNLKSIEIFRCDNLEEIIGRPLPTKTTCLLIKIEIGGCDNMKGVLLTHDVLRHLPFLQEIDVKVCKGIEVIIGAAPNMTTPSFPKLTRLTLRSLPKLKRICDQILSCDDIRFIRIVYCPNLKRIPLQLHLLDNGLLSPPPPLDRF